MAKAKKSPLTPREREVVRQIALGHKYREIAANMGVGYETIKTYSVRIRTKLKLSSRWQVGLWAIENQVK